MREFKDLVLLVVDDESDILDVYEDLFATWVGRLIRVSKAQEAFEVIKSQPVDVIISDLKMPQMTGIELLEKVRELNKAIPFLLVTGFGDKAAAVSALRLGAFDFLDKPFEVEKMKTTVTAALEAALHLRLLNGYFSKMTQALNHERAHPKASPEFLARLAKKSSEG